MRSVALVFPFICLDLHSRSPQFARHLLILFVRQLRHFSEQLVQQRVGAVFLCPRPEIGPVDDRAAHGEDVDDIVQVFASLPAEFLDDDIFHCGEPDLAVDLTKHSSIATAKSLAVVFILLIQPKQFDLKLGPCKPTNRQTIVRILEAQDYVVIIATDDDVRWDNPLVSIE